MLDEAPLPTFFTAEWSPDGAHLLLDRGHGEDAGFDLYRADGTFVRRHDGGDRAEWIDTELYLLTTPAEGGNEYEGAIVDVTSGDETATTLPTDFVIGDGHGVLALLEPYRFGGRCEPWGCPDPRFVLWTPEEGFTGWRTGRPLGWSRSGDQLFILNVDTPSKPIGAPAAPRVAGWLEVLSAPGMEVVHRYRDVRLSDDLFVLDPNGPHLAFIAAGADRQNEIRLLDLESGDVRKAATLGYRAVWNDNSQLIVGPTDNGSWVPSGEAVVLDSSGELVTTWSGVGEYLIGTPDGSALMFGEEYSSGTARLTVVTGGERLDIDPVSAPGYSFRCLPALAPDVSAIALSCHYYDDRGEVDNSVALLRPIR